MSPDDLPVVGYLATRVRSFPEYRGDAPKTLTGKCPGNSGVEEQEIDFVPKDPVLWVKFEGGKGSLLDRYTLDSDSGRVPLTPNMYLRPQAGASLSGLTTEAFFDHESFWSALDQFHRIALYFMAVNYRQSDEAERKRLHEKVHHDQVMVDRAIRDFSGLLVKEKSDPAMTPDLGSPLFSACEVVAGASKIELNSDVVGQLKDSRDPLGAITYAANIRKRQVLLTEKWWCSDNGPLLAFTSQDRRPVALLPQSPTRYHLVDPQEQTHTPINEANQDLVLPKAVMFYRPLPAHALHLLDLVRHVGMSVGPDVVIIFIMGLLAGLVGVVTPYVMGVVFDQVIPEAARTDLAFLAMGLFVVALSTALFSLTRGYALLRFEGKIDLSLQAAIWDRILSLPVPFFRNYTSGDLVLRAMSIETIRRKLSGTAITTLIGGVFSIFYFFQLFYYSWKMALLGAGLVVVALVPMFLGIIKMKLERKALHIQGKLSGMIFELINGIAKLRASGSERRAFAVWARQFKAEKALSYKVGMIKSFIATWNAAYSVVSLIAIFSFMMYLEGEDEAISLGNFLAFFAAFTLFLTAILEVSNTLIGLLNLIPVYERVSPILETLPEKRQGAMQPGELTGAIEINNLTFRYEEDYPPSLLDVSFRVDPGQFIAVVGPSGAGKSTLFRMLLGFERPAKGAIYYDGQDLAGLDVRAVRRQIGVVLQNGRLMPGTIFENIVGSLPLTMDDAWEAAVMAGFERDIKEMPMGMHTLISDAAETMSGGQIQRLLIARALANKPRLIFFDEATSALDNQSQAKVAQSLDRLSITRIVIAHRLSTIMNADSILVIDNGRLVQRGTYDSLMAREGVFTSLAKRQIA